MAITIQIHYSGTNGNAQKFAREMMHSGIVDKIRKEEGNLGYTYYLPMENEETVLLIDSWTDQQALDRHHASPMMQQIIALREQYDLHMRVERCRTDEAGVPQKDQAYIRK